MLHNFKGVLEVSQNSQEFFDESYNFIGNWLFTLYFSHLKVILFKLNSYCRRIWCD